MHHMHTHEQTPHTRGQIIHWAGRYDMLTNLLLLGKERAWRAATAEMAGIGQGDRVLDVGCGTGSLTLAAEALAGASGEVHGIDASPEMIEVARGKSTRSGANVDFRIGLIEEIPFPDDLFDVVLSSLMIHHLPDDLKRQGFVEIRRVLKPGGRFFAVDFAPPAAPLMQHLLSHVLGHGMMRVDVREYVPMLEEAGFEQVTAGKTPYRFIAFVRASKSQTV